jgi:hypothetical protein
VLGNLQCNSWVSDIKTSNRVQYGGC